MSEEKNIDFCELRNLVYEITDLNAFVEVKSGIVLIIESDD